MTDIEDRAKVYERYWNRPLASNTEEGRELSGHLKEVLIADLYKDPPKYIITETGDVLQLTRKSTGLITGRISLNSVVQRWLVTKKEAMAIVSDKVPDEQKREELRQRYLNRVERTKYD